MYGNVETYWDQDQEYKEHREDHECTRSSSNNQAPEDQKDTEAFKKYVLSVLSVASEVFAVDADISSLTHDGKTLHIVISSDKGLC